MIDSLQATAEALLRRACIMPVVTVDSVPQALQLAAALRDGGLTAIEFTLRTPAALDALAAVKEQHPDLAVGAGTVLQPAQIDAVVDVGADFIITPGTSPRLLDALVQAPIPVIPGVATASEAMTIAERGFRVAKLFPAGAVGGMALLKALHGPLPQLRFCPTGGIDAGSAGDYLALPNVLCVGGSWMVQKAWLDAGDYDSVRDASRQAAALSVRRRD